MSAIYQRLNAYVCQKKKQLNSSEGKDGDDRRCGHSGHLSVKGSSVLTGPVSVPGVTQLSLACTTVLYTHFQHCERLLEIHVAQKRANRCSLRPQPNVLLTFGNILLTLSIFCSYSLYSAHTVYLLLTLSIFRSHCLYSAHILCIFYTSHIPSIFCVHSLYILPTFRLYYVHIQSK